MYVIILFVLDEIYLIIMLVHVRTNRKYYAALLIFWTKCIPRKEFCARLVECVKRENFSPNILQYKV